VAFILGETGLARKSLDDVKARRRRRLKFLENDAKAPKLQLAYRRGWRMVK